MAQLSISLSSLQGPQQHKSQNPKFFSPSQSKTNQKFQHLHKNIKLKQHKLQYPIFFFPFYFLGNQKKERKLNNGYVLNLKKKKRRKLTNIQGRFGEEFREARCLIWLWWDWDCEPITKFSKTQNLYLSFLSIVNP